MHAGIVQVAGREHEVRWVPLLRVEQCGEALRRGSPGVVLVESDHEGFGKPGQFMRNGLVGIRRAQDRRGPKARRCC